MQYQLVKKVAMNLMESREGMVWGKKMEGRNAIEL